MSKQYTAITIGPIYDTMQLTSSPAGLWGASYLYSWIARELIQALTGLGVQEKDFVAPFFRLDEKEKVTLAFEGEDAVCEQMRSKGVGLFHDRVIFCSDELDKSLELVKAAREKVVSDLAGKLPGDEKENLKWLKSYLRIYALSMEVPEKKSPLIYLGKYLSAVELEPQFHSSERENKLLRLFENVSASEGEGKTGTEYRNALLKESFLRRELQGEWLLYGQGKKIRDLQSIASLGQKNIAKKHQQYYVVLKSDGDSMGKLLESLTDTEGVRGYSRKCLRFCAKAAELIQNYGGMPIYAGGDDLLALLPVAGYDPDSREHCTVFGLVEKLRTLFNESFERERESHEGKPTISFGLSIQYAKSPLYEALEKAGEMLEAAKGGKKNACYLHLQKHSGQSVTFCEEKMDRPKDSGEKNLYQELDELLRRTQSKEKDEDVTFLANAGYQVEGFRALFHRAILEPEERKEIVHNLYANLFDNAAQESFRVYLEELEKLTVQIFDQSIRGEEEEERAYLERTMMQVQSAIRLLHFMREKKEAEE